MSERTWYNQFNRPITNFFEIYEGAQDNRFRSRLPIADRDSSQNLPPRTRRQLLSRCRVLYKNVGFVKGAVRDIARYSVGDGLIPQSQIPDPTVRALYESYWTEWAKICEVTNKHCYGDVCRLRSIAIDVDGEIGQAYAETETGFPKLQLVESHRIESDPNDGTFRDGVRTDAMGAPRSYSIREGDNKYRTIDAADFSLLYDPDRCDAERGETAFSHGLNTIQDVLEILKAEKLSVKINSTLAMIIKVAQADASADNAFFGKQRGLTVGTSDLKLDTLLAGAIPRLQPGEEVLAHNSDRPSPTFTGFLDYLLRDIANGLGVPWEFVWDASKLGGSTNRLAIHKAQRKFNERQALLKKQATRDWGYVVSKAAKRGDLPYNDDWWRVVWQTTRKITVDEGRDADQNRKDIFAGLRTYAEDYSERGADWEESRDQQGREIDDVMERAKATSAKWKIPFEKALEFWQQRNPNPVPISSAVSSPPAQG